MTQREYQVHLIAQAQYPLNLFGRLEGASQNTTPQVKLTTGVQYRLLIAPLSTPKGWFRAEWSDWRPSGEPVIDWSTQAPQVSPWYYRLLPNGTIEILNTPEDPPWAHTLRASAVWFLQFVKPTSASAEWTVNEPYTSGEVVCRYRREKQTRTETHYRKQIVRLVNPKLMGDLILKLEGELRYVVRTRDHTVLSIEGTIREQSLAQGEVVSQSVNRVQVRFVREKPVPASLVSKWQSQLRQFQSQGRLLTVVNLPTPEEERLLRARALMGQRTLSTLALEIRALDELATPPEPSQTIPLQLALEGALVLYPNEARTFAETLLTQRSTPTQSFWVVLGAVSSSEQADTILLNALQRSTSNEVRLILARQMTLIRTVDPKNFTALWNLYQQTSEEELKSALGIALGAWVARLPESSRTLAQPFLVYLRKQLEEAELSQNEERIRYWLTVVSNTQLEQFLPFWERIARRGSEALRESVADLLTSLTSEKFTQLLVRWVSIEPAGVVRAKLARVLGQRWGHREVSRLLERLLFNDPDQSVRLAITDALANLAANNESAMRLLVRASRENSDERVRRQALLNLASLHAQGVSVPKE